MADYNSTSERMMGECFNPNLSLFIPFVYINSNTINFIKNIFYENQIGLVYHIDLIKNKNNKYCAFVYIRWMWNKTTFKIQNEIVGNENKYKFIYDESHNYFILLKNTNPKSYQQLVEQQEYILQKKIMKLNEEYSSKIEKCVTYAENNINAINCENCSRYTTEFSWRWDNQRQKYFPSMQIIDKRASAT